MSRPLIVGKSHVNCIINAAASNPALGDRFDIRRFSGEDKPGTISGKMLLALGTADDGPPHLFLSRPGALHNHIALFEPVEDFTILNPGQGEKGEQPAIPRRAMIEWILAESFDKPFLAQLAETWSDRVTFLAIPPPKQSTAFLHDRLSRRSTSAQLNGAVAQPGLGRPATRLAVWELEQQVIADWAAQKGIGFLWPPESTRNDAGFLKRRFYHADLTHANEDYGLEILRQVDQRLQTMGGE